MLKTAACNVRGFEDIMCRCHVMLLAHRMHTTRVHLDKYRRVPHTQGLFLTLLHMLQASDRDLPGIIGNLPYRKIKKSQN